jgi:hypothetical protein
MSGDELEVNFKAPDVLGDKLLDADSCGFQAECDPEEAEAMGAFSEDALDVDDALDGAADLAAVAGQ